MVVTQSPSAFSIAPTPSNMLKHIATPPPPFISAVHTHESREPPGATAGLQVASPLHAVYWEPHVVLAQVAQSLLWSLHVIPVPVDVVDVVVVPLVAVVPVAVVVPPVVVDVVMPVAVVEVVEDVDDVAPPLPAVEELPLHARSRTQGRADARRERERTSMGRPFIREVLNDARYRRFTNVSDPAAPEHGLVGGDALASVRRLTATAPGDVAQAVDRS